MQGRSALQIIRNYHPEVLRVVDAKKPVQIEVTAADCKDGKSKKPSACAMAKAFMREYDGAIISLSKAYLIKGQTATRYTVPQSVSREIVSFDRSRKFSPGEYHLDSIAKQHRLGKAHSTRPKHNSGGRGKVKARNHHTAGIRSL